MRAVFTTLTLLAVLTTAASCHCPQEEAKNQEILDRLTRIETAIAAIQKEPDRLLTVARAAVKAEEWSKASRTLEALAVRFPATPQDEAAKSLRKEIHGARFKDLEEAIDKAFSSATKAFDEMEEEIEKAPPAEPAKAAKPAKAATPPATPPAAKKPAKRPSALDLPMPPPKTGDDTAF